MMASRSNGLMAVLAEISSPHRINPDVFAAKEVKPPCLGGSAADSTHKQISHGSPTPTRQSSRNDLHRCVQRGQGTCVTYYTRHRRLHAIEPNWLQHVHLWNSISEYRTPITATVVKTWENSGGGRGRKGNDMQKRPCSHVVLQNDVRTEAEIACRSLERHAKTALFTCGSTEPSAKRARNCMSLRRTTCKQDPVRRSFYKTTLGKNRTCMSFGGTS